MNRNEIEQHIDWLEFKYAFKPTSNIRDFLDSAYELIIYESIANNYSTKEIETAFKSKVLSKIRL